MSSFIKDQPDIKNVYILGQNYSHGVQVAKYAKETLARKRPDIKIVGEDLHPLAQVRDFAPYIAKIKAVGRRHGDHRQLGLRPVAAGQGGQRGRLTTASSSPTTPASPARPRRWAPTAPAASTRSAYNHYNMGGEMDKWMGEFKQKYNDDFYTGATYRIFETLGAAMAKAKSTDPVKVAAALEGIKVKSFNGDVEVRKADHQLQQPLYISVWQKAGGKYPYSPENTGMTPGAGQGVPELRLQHAHQLPDEASRLKGRQASRSPCAVAGSFF
jgi:branched-chain amino acid transport system substrate-binding protein